LFKSLSRAGQRARSQEDIIMAVYPYSFAEERRAKWSLSSSEFTEILPDGSDGRVFKTGCIYRGKVEAEKCNELERLKTLRDPASDLEDLPGIKPHFEDDWCKNRPAQFTRFNQCTGTILVQQPRLKPLPPIS
jgi:hypothetical protein